MCGEYCYDILINNMSTKIQTLIAIAEEKMASSRDSIHDLSHVRRVVRHVERFAAGYILNDDQRDALVLAAWWHDVSRTIGSGTSLLVMPLFDDMISACMLWFYTIRYRLFGDVAGMAARMIFCKSLGTGGLLTRILMRRDQRILVDLLMDADRVDIIHTERVERILALAETSRIHRFGYRLVVRWHMGMNRLPLRTDIAKEYIFEMMKRLLEWIKDPHIYNWHVRQFGQEWVERTVRMIVIFFDDLARTANTNSVGIA